MSRFEKIFWLTIIILAIAYMILQILAINNKVQTDVRVILDPVVLSVNLDKANSDITRNAKHELSNINNTIDVNIDNAFNSIENNIESFLDFHYSVIGEYSELGAMATNKINETIKNRLLGSGFENNVKEAFKNIDAKYSDSVNKHIQLIRKSATVNVDHKLNNDILISLENDISSFTLVQEGKLGLILGARLIPKMVSVITAKIALKASSKFIIKSSAKVGAKYATTGTAALAGTACGPFVWVCSPLLAITAWFSTDAVIVNVDEYYNRKKFKREILEVVNKQKAMLKHDTKLGYEKSFKKLSKKIQLKYRNTAIKKLKIKERF